jgi:hypothetical protein
VFFGGFVKIKIRNEMTEGASFFDSLSRNLLLVVCAYRLSLSPGAPLPSGTGMGSLSSTALSYPDLRERYAKIL